MIDIKFLRENPDAVKENIKKKFQDYKLPLVDQVIELDEQSRAVKKQADELRSNRNKISKQIGSLMAQGKREEAMALIIVPKFLTEIQITGDSQSHTVSYFKSLTACIGTIL